MYYMDSTASYDPFDLREGFLGVLVPGLQGFMGSPTQDSMSYSAFFQGSYDVTENSKITAGLRWSKDEREREESSAFDFGAFQASAPTIKDDVSWEEPTWRLSVDHRLGDSNFDLRKLQPRP